MPSTTRPRTVLDGRGFGPFIRFSGKQVTSPASTLPSAPLDVAVLEVGQSGIEPRAAPEPKSGAHAANGRERRRSEGLQIAARRRSEALPTIPRRLEARSSHPWKMFPVKIPAPCGPSRRTARA
jgi:hypothetical protein